MRSPFQTSCQNHSGKHILNEDESVFFTLEFCKKDNGKDCDIYKNTKKWLHTMKLMAF